MSQLATLYFLISIAECIGEADVIKPLNHNRKKLEMWNACCGWMTQSRDEDHSDMINRIKCLAGNGKEMIIAGDSSVLIFLAFSRRFSCTCIWHTQVRTVSVTVASQVAQRPSRHEIDWYHRVICLYIFYELALDKVRHIKSLNTMMVMGSARISFVW